jgi:hypothetical protein
MQADTNFPPYSLFENIELFFEEGEKCSRRQSFEIGETATVRHSFAPSSKAGD